MGEIASAADHARHIRTRPGHASEGDGDDPKSLGEKNKLLTLEPRDAEPFFRNEASPGKKCGIWTSGKCLAARSAVDQQLAAGRHHAGGDPQTRPDAVISFMDTINVLTLISTVGMPVPVIIKEHAEPGDGVTCVAVANNARSSIVAPRL